MAMSHWSDFVDADGPDGAYLPWKKVESRVGISRTTAWRLQKADDFPKPYVVSPGRVAYRESEVEAWKASRGHRSPAAVVPRAGRASRDAPAPAPQPASLPTPPLAGRAAEPAPLALTPPAPQMPPPRRIVRPRPRARTAKPQGDQMTFNF